MAKQRYINTKFWSDNWVIELDPLERYLFLYFLTNEHTNIAGIYELPIRTMAFETGIEKEMLIKMLPRFQSKVYYIDGWVYIKNFAKHQAVNDSVSKGIKASLSEIPKEILEKINSLGTPSDTLSDPATYLNLNSNVDLNSNVPNSKNSDKKQEIIKFTQKDIDLVKLMVSLIQKNNPQWKLKGNLDKWAEDINKINRIDERTYEQIEYMIKWTQKDPFWSQNILSASKLREKFNDLIPKLKGMIKPKNYVL